MSGSVRHLRSQTPRPPDPKSIEQLRQEAIAEAKFLEREFEVRLNACRVILRLLEKPEQVTARTHP